MMICYMDKTWCTFYETCKKGKECRAALTPEVIEEAKEWMNPPSICQYAEPPKCYDKRRKK